MTQTAGDCYAGVFAGAYTPADVQQSSPDTRRLNSQEGQQHRSPVVIGKTKSLSQGV